MRFQITLLIFGIYFLESKATISIYYCMCVCAGTKPLGLGQREADAARPQHGLGQQPVHHHFPGKLYFGPMCFLRVDSGFLRVGSDSGESQF